MFSYPYTWPVIEEEIKSLRFRIIQILEYYEINKDIIQDAVSDLVEIVEDFEKNVRETNSKIRNYAEEYTKEIAKELEYIQQELDTYKENEK
jgi:hypothetical protein